MIIRYSLEILGFLSLSCVAWTSPTDLGKSFCSMVPSPCVHECVNGRCTCDYGFVPTSDGRFCRSGTASSSSDPPLLFYRKNRSIEAIGLSSNYGKKMITIQNEVLGSNFTDYLMGKKIYRNIYDRKLYTP